MLPPAAQIVLISAKVRSRRKLPRESTFQKPETSDPTTSRKPLKGPLDAVIAGTMVKSV